MQKITSLLLQKNGVRFDKEELYFQIQSHPSYPSLHAITGVLDHFNIVNLAARIPNNPKVLNELSGSFIAQFQHGKNQGLFLVEKLTDSYKLMSAEGSIKEVSTSEFHQAFTGVILAIGSQRSYIHKKSFKSFYTRITSAITLLGFISLFFISTTNIFSEILFLTSLIGVAISFSIIQQELGVRNTIGDAFCSSNSDKKNCHAVLTSKGAHLFGSYKLSDVSLIYFLGFTISAFLLIMNGQDLQLLNFINFLALPVTVYSIYYQAVTVKTRCLLCMSIVAVLWIQAGISFFQYPFSIPVYFSLEVASIILFGFFSSFSIWSYLKPVYKEFVENKSHKISYFRFKKKYNLFSKLLKEEDAMHTEVKKDREIVYGNPDSKVEIIIVTSPFCSHCKPVHKIIEETLDRYGSKVKVIIRFNILLTNMSSDGFTIASNLMHIHLEKGRKKSFLAMQEIYDDMPFGKWKKKWCDPKINEEYYYKVLKEQSEWCIRNNINFTPEILINGYVFPKEYNREDLLFFIEELDEEYNT